MQTAYIVTGYRTAVAKSKRGGVFVLSLAVGNEMPNLVNLGIMLDVFASVLILGTFLNKIGDVFKAVDVDQLSNLKDY